MSMITENIRALLVDIPPSVTLVAACKTRTVEEVNEALDAGLTVMGHNYLQEGQAMIPVIGDRARWHFIGHVQKNKVRHVVPLFDMIETVDSLELGQMIDRQAGRCHKVMSVLVEVNSGREAQKNGVFPEDVPDLVRGLGALANVRVEGLMTMGPWTDDAETLRPCFRETRRVFDALAAEEIPGVCMRHLSMGMSGSYRVGIEEGSTLVRIGTKIFGPRPAR